MNTTSTIDPTPDMSGSGVGDTGGEGEEETEDTESTEVCGTDGVTYRSICHLIQTTSNIQVLYAGHCNAADCNQGQVRKLYKNGKVVVRNHFIPP